MAGNPNALTVNLANVQKYSRLEDENGRIIRPNIQVHDSPNAFVLVVPKEETPYIPVKEKDGKEVDGKFAVCATTHGNADTGFEYHGKSLIVSVICMIAHGDGKGAATVAKKKTRAVTL